MTYYVYISTNPSRTVYYTGCTHDLRGRLLEHREEFPHGRTFAGRYNAFCYLYHEEFSNRQDAYKRTKQIKGWRREKKINLIRTKNPELNVIWPENL